MNNEHITGESDRTTGKEARRNNILAARIIAETVKTTLGPKGMDKMLVDKTGNITITNDGVTILQEMELEHPVAKMLVDIATTQEQEIGDGTTTAVMITGKLLENAETLLEQNIHPTTIIKGYQKALTKAQQLLKEEAQTIEKEEVLTQIAQTAMTGKAAEQQKEYLARTIVKAVNTVTKGAYVPKERIMIKKETGNNNKTELIKGIVLEKGKVNQDMPRIIHKAKIALIEEALELPKLEQETRYTITNPEQLTQFIEQEEAQLRKKIRELEETGANVIITQKGMDELIQYELAKKGIYALRRINKEDMEQLAKATRGTIVANTKELKEETLGTAEKVEEKRKGEETNTYITGCKNPQAVTIMVRGGTEHVTDETKRALEDALGDVATVIQHKKIVAGGGAIETRIAHKLRNYAKQHKGKEALAIEQFANTLEYIPITLAENAGLDTLDTMTALRAEHEHNNRTMGLNLLTNTIEDTMKTGIIEPLHIKLQALQAANDVTTMILRIDDVIAAKNQQTKKNNNLQDYD